MDFRRRLLEAATEEEFKGLLLKHAQELANEQADIDQKTVENHTNGGSAEEYQYVSTALQIIEKL